MTDATPSFQEFKRLARSFNIIPVYREIVVDRVTPVLAYERLSHGEKYAFLLESVEGGERLGRYSFVGQRPHAVFTCKAGRVTYRENGNPLRSWPVDNPLQDLKQIFEQFKPEIGRA